MWPSGKSGDSSGHLNKDNDQKDLSDSHVDLDNMWPSQRPKSQSKSGGGASAAEVKELEEQLKKAKDEHQKDKDFYEEALEARMNQMDELEQKNEKLEEQVAELKDEIDRL